MELQDRLSAALAGRYEIDGELGRGGMAVVYLARDLRHERRVAIKVLRPEFAASLVADRFLREIRIAAQLQHPLIVPLHDSGASDGLLWYVMPYVEGETLRDRLKRERQLSAEEALRIASEVAEALAHAHEHGVIHRDIKPENILLSGGHALVADFGIARAVTAAGGQLITSTGSAIGTPAYMSPEQGAGDTGLDARSDIYSLGCVLYELLAGEPPFTGPTPQSVIAKHVSQPPPSVRVLRPALPAGLESLIARALAKAPADRFRTATELLEALETGAAGASRRWPIPKSWLAAGAVALLAAAVALLRPVIFLGVDVNPAAYVMASFPGGLAPSYRMLEHELYSALRQVPDITLMESLRVNDQVLRRGGEATDLGSWLAVARALGAGRLVVPTAVEGEDSIEIVAEMYDVRRGRAIGRAGTRLGKGLTDLATEAARLTERLFNMPAGAVPTFASTVPAAARAFVAGKTALSEWDLRAAEQQFQAAIRHDPAYAEAQFWLAQVKAWAGDAAESWVGSARRAVAGGGQLADATERSLATALRAMAERRFPEACAQYDSLLAADSTSFEAWFGLGECHAKDDVVIPDPTSPSRWRWRSSFHTAAKAYERALELVSSFAFAFQPSVRLANVLFVETYALRPGRPLPPDSGVFVAYPSLVDDTIGFIPFPDSLLATTRSPVTSLEAVRRQRVQFRRMAGSWARAFPDSSRANQELTRSLELLGELDGSENVETSAMAAARRARRTARDAADSVLSVVLEIRLLVKLGRFEEAREQASEALRRWPDPEPRRAWYLASLSALIGRVHLTARLGAIGTRARQADPRYEEVLRPIREASEGGLLAYASLGAPAESIAAFASRVDSLLQVHTDPDLAAQLRCGALRMPLAYAFPQLRRVTDRPECRRRVPFMEMQWALTLDHTAEVLAVFRRELERRRPSVLPGDLAINHVYHEAWLLLQVGDTATATQHLDTHLAALPAYRRTIVLAEPDETAALIRAMALRAELAARAGDQVAARRWAEPVTILWRDADDPELQNLVRKMRDLARLGSRRR